MLQKRFNLTYRGFTLIELLVALAVFSFIATITAYTLQHLLKNQQRLTIESNRIDVIEQSYLILKIDTYRAIGRFMVKNDTEIQPMFNGQRNKIEWTTNNNTIQLDQKLSALRRVGYQCEDNKLIRYLFIQPDLVNNHPTAKRTLLNELTSCEFEFLNKSNQWLSTWREGQHPGSSSPNPIPKAIRISLKTKDGKLQWVFPMGGDNVLNHSK
jgi:general secretion pathway protein J